MAAELSRDRGHGQIIQESGRRGQLNQQGLRPVGCEVKGQGLVQWPSSFQTVVNCVLH